jgi:WD40 repeat protein
VPKQRTTIEAHTYDVRDIAFSPDGKTIASCGDTLTIKLWNIASGKNTSTFKGHSPDAKRSQLGTIFALAYSPDGKTLASGGDDMTARLWDVGTGENTATFADQAAVTLLAFSPDGKSLFGRGSELRLWDLKTRNARTILKGCTGWRHAVAFDPKGKLMVAAVDNRLDSAFALWDVETGKRTIAYEGHTKTIGILAFSPDCKTLASSAWDKTVRLWDVATGKNRAIFKSPPGRTCSLVFSHDGKILAAGYKHQEKDGETDSSPNAGSVRLYDTTTGKVLATLTGKPGPISPLAFSPKGRLLASGSFDGKVTLWSLPARYDMGK